MRTLNTRFKRLLRLRDFEFFQVELNDDDRTAFLLFIDERSLDSEEDNNVKIFLISHFELSESSYQDVLSFNDDLLGMKYNCSYVMDTLTVKEEFDFDFPFDMLAIREYVQELLSTLKIDKKLPKLKETDFNYLSQE
ncbi:hypothetical protein BUN12_3150 [Bacillus amyloliquefaciens]|uniref:YnaF n=1 Tax=Bacillus amyloliquefaciens (strain ATCC 23350 / DSM 7 / BCRC 11601 / CCUG 28519 / NBRC 15535 / NRRL B-14393 / F) TaxID=692420 RepID=A0A9P1JL57_BACAS|nr:hypothetical protein LL3_04224 [Bacillus amyloliquefaciens LL3]AZV91402.1 hypothetical protein BUN12_3150 [Bacillus amyloliquefaciens]CBI45019.1 YnaF [Bacillus amyloliquefaciens DSM 7] [Bacillus amyloliquefaciens DSM 7 = ATCC 23350]MBW8281154.1 hypothetical protein [Bacillus amyloliquefaciens]MDR4378936.1 hypothetical protein [Bacillus amyloliquefaciens]